ncbi:MAG: response regulator receiver protein [Planctomycetaceae bacterium]|nr:response regulator receiver protein [Planctomycetaceae bacterium]
MPRVLVVDDSLTERQLVGALLAKLPDWEVDLAENGKEALEYVEASVPDLIVTDLRMPEMDGLELVEAVKEDFPLVPVILMTAKGSEEIAVQALQQGAASYVPKNKLADELPSVVIRVHASAVEDRSFLRLTHHITRNETSFELHTDLELIYSLVKHLRHTVRCVELGDEMERMRVGIALEEALMNAYYHGCLEMPTDLEQEDRAAYEKLASERSQQEPYSERQIRVDVNLNREQATYVIQDDGPGFDSQAVLESAGDELNEGTSRGVLLMKSFMDEVTFSDKGNQVTLTKRRPPSLTLSVSDA